MAINTVTISGNITREPEYKQTASGMGILGFCVAVNDRKQNNQTGEWEDYPNFIDCTILGNRADALSSILAKGMKVSVSGKLHQSRWEKDGQKRSKLEVTVGEVEFMSQRKQDAQSDAQYADAVLYEEPQPLRETIDAVQQQSAGQQQGGVYDEDIPF
ncbi:MAG: single-stranded DNA-binding protein [Eggerthellaceae bacterium]|nr:single-stranded DNA-binding protein [Eggerthellaceae bacterium]